MQRRRGLIDYAIRLRKPKKIVDVPKGTVVLHQFYPINGLPSISPPCLKLESYLRMAKIPYINNYGIEPSKKGKLPWITYNDAQVADSNLCIEFLNKEFNVDLDDGLDDEQRGASLAIRRMCDENTYWAMVYYRWIENFEKTRRFFKISKFEFVDNMVCSVMRRRVKNQLEGHGIGLHTRDEVYQLGKEDIKAVSDYLGGKKFLMGDKASLVDASVFGVMASLLWVDTGSPLHTMIKQNCTNIERFCNTMKDTFWPDWESVVYKGRAKKSKL